MTIAMRKRRGLRVAVVGAAGRLGSLLVEELASRQHEVVPLTRSAMDVASERHVWATLGPLEPDVIVNCSAYNLVDAAEQDPATAFAVNAQGPAHLARVACDQDALLVHFSTDFVFDGRKAAPYTEEDAPNPLNVYGASKLAGEREVARAPRHYVLRVESLFGGAAACGATATVDHMADRLRRGEPVRAAIDRVVSPTYAPDAVLAVVKLIEGRAPFGTYHCINTGYAAWYEVARAIAHEIGSPTPIVAIKADDLRASAPRPRFCALSAGKLSAAGIPMPDWRDALRRHLAGQRRREACLPLKAGAARP